jgi:hypothetical protein
LADNARGDVGSTAWRKADEDAQWFDRIGQKLGCVHAERRGAAKHRCQNSSHHGRDFATKSPGRTLKLDAHDTRQHTALQIILIRWRKS